MNDRSSLAPTLRSAFVDFHHSQPLLYLQPRRPLLPELVLQLIQPAPQHRGGRSFVGRGCGSTLSRNSRRPGGPPGGSDGPHALTFALVVVIVVGVLVAVGSSKRPVLPELSPECFLLDDLLDLEDGSGVSAVSRGKLGPSSVSHLDPRARTLHLVQVIRHLVPSTPIRRTRRWSSQQCLFLFSRVFSIVSGFSVNRPTKRGRTFCQTEPITVFRKAGLPRSPSSHRASRRSTEP